MVMLSDFKEKDDDKYSSDKEISEAIKAGEKALDSLNDAKDKLSSASNWGLFDILGGGGISSMIKHSKMRDAKYEMEKASRDLKRFYKELGDIKTDEEFDIITDDFLTFADTFFDNFIFDILVQNRISESKDKIDEAIERIENILEKLEEIEN